MKEKILREGINKNEDILVYNNEDYLIYKKHGQTTGTLLASLDLLHIAIEGLKHEDEPQILFYKDYKEVILKAIMELEETINNYPKDK